MHRLLDRPARYRLRTARPVLETLRALPAQCRSGYAAGRAVRLARRHRRPSAVVICGMGGSALGSDVIRAVFGRDLRIPLTIVNDYRLPGWVGRETLVILSSYSGTTEEVLAAGRAAIHRRSAVIGVTTGGGLAKLLQQARAPWVRLDPATNPSDQPRMGLVLSTMAQIGLLRSLGELSVSPSDVDQLATELRRRDKRFGPDVPLATNGAKRLAVALEGRIPILAAAEHAVGSMHAFANQLNETAKTYAAAFPLPELNHHLLEGLRFPPPIRRGAFVTASSALYDQRLQLRLITSAKILRRQGLAHVPVRLRAPNRLAQAVELLQISGYTSFYLSMLNRVNPLSIPTVETLKRTLAGARR